MNKPIIGIIGNIFIIEGGMFSGMERSYVNHDYVEAILKAGGVPVIIPVNTNPQDIELQIKRVDAVLLSGGYDVNPLLYGEEPIEKLDFMYPEVDDFYLKAIQITAAMKKPMLGICKGMQTINIAFGGTLYQDMTQIPGCTLKHVQNAKRNTATHTIEIERNSWLYSVLGSQAVTNSFHHQAVKDLANEFKVVARSKDGVVEAIEKEGNEFIIGVQWHPEMMAQCHENMLQLLKSWISHCNERSNNSNE